METNSIFKAGSVGAEGDDDGLMGSRKPVTHDSISFHTHKPNGNVGQTNAPQTVDENPDVLITLTDPPIQNGNVETETLNSVQEKLKDMAGRLNIFFMSPNTKFVNWWIKIFIISCLLATFLDPLFFFPLSVQLENKCIVFDWTMAWVIVGLRSITDLVYLCHILLQLRLEHISREKIAHKYIHGWFLTDLFVVLPLPQIMTIFVSTSHISSSANDMKNMLRLVVLFQCVPRLCRILPMVAGRSVTGFTFETAWANFNLNIFFFVLAGHFLGSCWYLFGLERVGRCLRDACYSTHISSCKHLIDCGYMSNEEDGLYRNLDQWRNNSRAISCFSAEDFRYGIYLQAVNLTTVQSAGARYIYSLFWGFQQLSTLAGNQTPSYYISEVLFTMSIAALGLFLFALLIGNIQNFLQAFDKRRFEIMLRRCDLDHWMSHHDLPAELTERVREAERYSWIATKGVDEDILMASLPEDVQTEIRRHLFKVVKEINIFSAMDEYVMDLIYERLKQKTFIKGSQILISGGQIKKITFIKRGKMKSIGDDGSEDELCEGNVCGHELLLWCLEDSLAHQANTRRTIVEGPKSNRRVTCLTDVEVFTLAASDLKEVNRLGGNFLQKSRVQEAIMASFGKTLQQNT